MRRYRVFKNYRYAEDLSYQGKNSSESNSFQLVGKNQNNQHLEQLTGKNKHLVPSKIMVVIVLLLSTIFSGFAKTNPDSKEPDKLLNLDPKGVILDGYDPVAFFTKNMPVKGVEQYQTKYNGAVYYFSSEENKKLFETQPVKYEPQFGGFCAYAVSLGRTAPIDVNTFSIVNGRLVIQHNQKAVNGWNKDVRGNLEKADKYWPSVVRNGGKQIVTEEESKFLVNTNPAGVLIEGYDPVSYFNNNKPVKGSDEFQSRYHGATYLFATAENKKTFDEDPGKFEPQYGGFCAYAVSVGKLRPIDPAIFQFVDGRLMFQHTQKAYELFNKDTEGSTKAADKNWPSLLKKHAGKKVKYDTIAK